MADERPFQAALAYTPFSLKELKKVDSGMLSTPDGEMGKHQKIIRKLRGLLRFYNSYYSWLMSSWRYTYFLVTVADK